MAQSRTKTVRASEEQWARWREASGGNLNRWICDALDQQVDLDKALARLEEAVPVTQQPVTVTQTRASDFTFRPDPKGGKKR